jgi:hypothetical protein
MKTAASLSSLREAWGGGPPKVVEGPRGSAENASITLANLNMKS